MNKKLIANIIVVVLATQSVGLSHLLAESAGNNLRPPAAALIPRNVVLQPVERCNASGELEGVMGIPTERSIEVYRRASKPGVYMVTIEATSVGHESRARAQQIILTKEKGHIEGMKKVIDAIHEESKDTLAIVQLNHSGSISDPRFSRVVRVYPPQEDGPDNIPGDILTPQEVQGAIDAFIDAAEAAYLAGANGVDVKCCHGYLLDQFLRPANTRKDGFGGGFNDRVKIVEEIVSGIKDRIKETNKRERRRIKGLVKPKDFIIMSRISMYEGMIGGIGTKGPDDKPITPEELSKMDDKAVKEMLKEPLELIRRLAKLGVRIFNISAGVSKYNVDEWVRPARPPEGFSTGKGRVNLDVYHHLRFSRLVKEFLHKMGIDDAVVIASGLSIFGEDLKDVAQLAIDKGYADKVSIGRQSLAEPNIFLSEYNICKRCNGCSRLLIKQTCVGCALYDKFYRKLSQQPAFTNPVALKGKAYPAPLFIDPEADGFTPLAEKLAGKYPQFKKGRRRVAVKRTDSGGQRGFIYERLAYEFACFLGMQDDVAAVQVHGNYPDHAGCVDIWQGAVGFSETNFYKDRDNGIAKNGICIRHWAGNRPPILEFNYEPWFEILDEPAQLVREDLFRVFLGHADLLTLDVYKPENILLKPVRDGKYAMRIIDFSDVVDYPLAERARYLKARAHYYLEHAPELLVAIADMTPQDIEGLISWQRNIFQAYLRKDGSDSKVDDRLKGMSEQLISVQEMIKKTLSSEITQARIRLKVKRIKEIDTIMGTGVVDSKAEDIEQAIKNPMLGTVDEIADVLCVYLSMLSHLAGNYEPEDDKGFRDTDIWQKINAEISGTEKPVPEEYFRLLWQEALSHVSQRNVEKIKTRIPKKFLPLGDFSDMRELEKWFHYFLANFRTITFRRDKNTDIFTPLRRYTPAEVRMALIKTQEEEEKKAAQKIDDVQAAAHLSKKSELVELCEALKKARYEEEAQDILDAFKHALLISDDPASHHVALAVSNNAITKLVELARKVTGNPGLSVIDLLKKAYTNRLTRNFLGFVHPEEGFKDKFLEKVWSAEIFVLSPQTKASPAGAAQPLLIETVDPAAIPPRVYEKLGISKGKLTAGRIKVKQTPKYVIIRDTRYDTTWFLKRGTYGVIRKEKCRPVFSPDNRYMVYSKRVYGTHYRVLVYATDDLSKPVITCKQRGRDIMHHKFSPDIKHICLVMDRDILLFDLSNGEKMLDLTSIGEDSISPDYASFSPMGGYFKAMIMTSGHNIGGFVYYDTCTRFLDLSKKEGKRELLKVAKKYDEPGSRYSSFSPDNQHIIIENKGNLELRRLNRIKKVIANYDLKQPKTKHKYSPDNRFVVFYNYDKLELYDLEKDKCVMTKTRPNEGYIDFSPDSKWFLCSTEGYIELCRTADPSRAEARIRIPPDGDYTFISDNKYLAILRRYQRRHHDIFYATDILLYDLSGPRLQCRKIPLKREVRNWGVNRQGILYTEDGHRGPRTLYPFEPSGEPDTSTLQIDAEKEGSVQNAFESSA